MATSLVEWANQGSYRYSSNITVCLASREAALSERWEKKPRAQQGSERNQVSVTEKYPNNSWYLGLRWSGLLRWSTSHHQSSLSIQLFI